MADASLAIAWVHPAQATAQTEAMLDAMSEGATIEVPALWRLEVANALLVLTRRRKLSESECNQALRWLSGLPVTLDHEMVGLAWSKLSELAVAHQLSVYDAAYLELAVRRRLALACKDGPLKRAASAEGLPAWT